MGSKLRLLLPVALTALLALASAQNVFASTEIAYDDGTFVNWILSAYLGVRFTPSGQVRVVGARIYFYNTAALTTVYVLAADKSVLYSIPVSNPSTNWQTIMFGGGPVISTDFFIALTSSPPSIGMDAAYNNGRNYVGPTLAGLASMPLSSGDFMIRALVDTSVGGVVLPTNSLTALAPYLAVIGLVATAAVAAKKRRN